MAVHSLMQAQALARLPLRAARRLFSAAARNPIGTITHVTTREPLVALTFDDGPHPEYTPALLNTLARYQARATFFMMGEAAERHPEIVEHVAASGHAIGNHSWDHPSFPLISSRERRAQIRACARVLAPFGSRLFRPPYAEQNLASAFDAIVLGYRIVMFNVSTDDWCGGNAVAIAEQLERQIHPGCVMVLHDRLQDTLTKSYFNREAVVESVRMILERVRQRFRFVTVPELLRHGIVQKEIWYKEADLQLLNKLFTESGPGRRYAQDPRNHRLESLLLGESR